MKYAAVPLLPNHSAQVVADGSGEIRELLLRVNGLIFKGLPVKTIGTDIILMTDKSGLWREDLARAISHKRFVLQQVLPRGLG